MLPPEAPRLKIPHFVSILVFPETLSLLFPLALQFILADIYHPLLVSSRHIIWGGFPCPFFFWCSCRSLLILSKTKIYLVSSKSEMFFLFCVFCLIISIDLNLATSSYWNWKLKRNQIENWIWSMRTHSTTNRRERLHSFLYEPYSNYLLRLWTHLRILRHCNAPKIYTLFWLENILHEVDPISSLPF